MTTSNVHKILMIGLFSILVIALLPVFAKVHHRAEASLGLISIQRRDTQVIPAAAFIQSAGPNKAIDYANNWFFDIDDGSITGDSVADRICLVAPVYLPPDSRIESFTAYVQDDFAAGNLTIFLDKADFFGVWNELAQMTSTNQSGIRPLTTSEISTDNQANIVSSEATYHVTFCLPANSGGSIKFYGAQINYLPPDTLANSYLPIIFRPVPTVTPPPIPPTTLIVTNQTGGGLTYTIFGTPEGDITCQIPNGQAEVCGVFTAGTYSFKAVAHCGQKVGERTYKPGQDALTPFRCG